MQEILARMEKALSEIQDQSQLAGCVPFLYTYTAVTKNIIEHGRQPHFYEHPEALRELDVYFAQQYFDPLQHFLNTPAAGSTPISSPWRTYYEYARRPHPRAFVALLLGVNAHINGDLPVALATTHYGHEADFNNIDPVLTEVLPQTMRFLAKEFHDFQAMGGVLFPKFAEREFAQMAIRWRHQAWDNALKMNAQNSQDGREAVRKSIHQQTEQLAQQLIPLFEHPLTSIFHQAEWRRLGVQI